MTFLDEVEKARVEADDQREFCVLKKQQGVGPDDDALVAIALELRALGLTLQYLFPR